MLYFAPWKVVIIVVVCALGVLFATPNLFTQRALDTLPAWVPARRVNLGLDLRGGSYLLYRLDMKPVVEDSLNNIADELRARFRQTRIGYTHGFTVTNEALTFQLLDPALASKAVPDVRAIDPRLEVTADQQGNVVVRFSQAALQQRQAEALRQSIEIIRRRIDATGIKEPSIESQGTGRISVQLPGVGTPDRITRSSARRQS